jgi:hypothetical protein
MSKNRLLSGKKKKLTGADLSAERYDYLDVSNAEPDLGLPPVDNSILIGDLDGSRTWIDIIDYAEEFKGYTGSQGDIGFAGSAGEVGFTGSAGTSGSDGTSGSAGEPGYTGSQGGLGYTGSKGVDGQFGGASFYYIFDSSEYINTVPDGYFRLDTNDTTLVTFVALADTDRFGTNIATFIQTIDDSTSDIKGYIKLTEENNVNNFTIFAIVGVHSTHDEHFHIPISYISGAVSAPLIDTNFIISFTVNGDRGDIGFTGSQGDIGFAGSQGNTGFTGSKGFTGSAGDTGFTGSQGAGFAGSQGDLGFTGSRGSAGFTGSRGDVGFTGSGAAGSDGTDGAAGFTGSKGDQGIQGFTGSSGSGSGGTTVLERHYRKTGTLTVSVGSEKWYIPLDSTIIGIIARVETAPTGTSNGIQIGVNVTDTVGNKTAVATLNINNLDKASNVFSTPLTVLINKFVTVDILSVGTNIAGADLTVTFTYTRI